MSDAVSSNAWTRVALGDVVRQVRTRVDPEASGLERYVAGEHMDTGDLRIRRWGLIGDGYLGPAFHMRFKPGQVLYGSRRTYLRKVAVAEFEGITANTTFVLESKDPRVLLPELLPFLMQTDSFNEHSIKQSKGSVNPYVNFSDLTWYQFALPPLQEQRRIADALTAIRITQDSHARTATSLRVAMEALVAEVLSELQTSTAPSLLEEHADIKYGLTVGPERRKRQEQIPYLRVANVQRGDFDLAEIKSVGKMPDDDMYRLAPGDVLVVEGHASVDQIGRAAVWNNERPEMFHQNHLIRARCADHLNAEYLCLLINSHHGQRYFRSRAKSTSGLSTINSTVVKEYSIPVPDLVIQSGILEKFRAGRCLLNEVAHRQDILARMRRSVLDRLCDGHQ